VEFLLLLDEIVGFKILKLLDRFGL